MLGTGWQTIQGWFEGSSQIVILVLQVLLVTWGLIREIKLTNRLKGDDNAEGSHYEKTCQYEQRSRKEKGKGKTQQEVSGNIINITQQGSVSTASRGNSGE